MKATVEVTGKKWATAITICAKALQDEGYAVEYAALHVLEVSKKEDIDG